MSIAKKHRNIEYMVRSVGADEWEWTCYPKVERGSKITGKVKGSHQAADAACQKAIDAAIDGSSN
jgi:hypothetical protein